MAKLQPQEVTLVDVAEISADPAHRTGTTPFGALPGRAVRYVGRAVMWKNNFAAAPEKVVAGLTKAIKISKGCAGTKGIGVNPLNGEVVPNKVLCQMKAAGKINR
jgi:hypothetical protein